MDKRTMEFYDEDSKNYENERFSSLAGKYSDSVHKNIVLNFSQPLENKKVLDVCCGTGRFSIELAKKGAIVTSVDFSHGMINILKKKVGELELVDRISPIRMDVQKMQFENNTFDGCVCITAIHLIKDYVKVLHEINRVLKPNGFFIVNFPNMLSFYFPVGAYVNMTKKSIQKDVYSKWFTFNEIKNAFSEAGLKITGIKGYIWIPTNISGSIFRFFKKLDAISRDSLLKYISGSLFIKGIRVR